MKLDLGQTVDRYVVERILGAGGTAMVYLVRHNNLGTLHALKVLTLTGSSIRERMEREGRVQARLHHPNIVAVTDQLDVDGAIGLLMEYVDGPSLEAALQRYRLTMGDAETLFHGILAGVRAAHAEGLVHRDLKPANVLLSRSPEGFVPKVTDFGLAKMLEQDPSVAHTRSGIAMGTPSYMAPEQIRDARSVDQRADIWSLGCILYELTTRVRAFPGDEALAIYNAVVDGDYLPPRSHVPDMPERVNQAILGCLQIDPDARIPDCDTLTAVLAGTLPWILDAEPPPPAEPVTEDFLKNQPLGDSDKPFLDPRSPGEVPTISVSQRTLRSAQRATPAPATPRLSSAQDGLAPIEMGSRIGLGAFPATFGEIDAGAGDEQETVITSHRALDGTLSPLDSFDGPARAGLLSVLGGSLLAVGLLGLAVGGIIVVIGLLIGSVMLSRDDLTELAPQETQDPAGVQPAGVQPAEVQPGGLQPGVQPAPAQPAQPAPKETAPKPARPEAPKPRPAQPVPASVAPVPAPVEAPEPEFSDPIPQPAKPKPAPADGKRWVVVRTDPLVAEIQIAGGARIRTPSKIEIPPGSYVVRAWSGEKGAEFVIFVDDNPEAVNEFCYSFRTDQVVLGTCPPG